MTGKRMLSVGLGALGAPILDLLVRLPDHHTLYFTEEPMAILKETLGYACRRIPLTEVEDRAQELRARYRAVAQQVD